MEDRLAGAGARRVGGRGAKPGATYRQGEFKGMTAGQAWAKMTGEKPGQPSPNSTGGRAAPHSAAQVNANRTGGIDGYRAMQRPGGPAPTSAIPANDPTAPVREFRNSPGVVDARAAAKPTAPDRAAMVGTARGAMESAQARLFGSTITPPAVQPTPGASNPDPVADFRQSLTQAASPAVPATPAAPAATTAKAPAAGASPEKKRPS